MQEDTSQASAAGRHSRGSATTASDCAHGSPAAGGSRIAGHHSTACMEDQNPSPPSPLSAMRSSSSIRVSMVCGLGGTSVSDSLLPALSATSSAACRIAEPPSCDCMPSCCREAGAPGALCTSGKGKQSLPSPRSSHSLALSGSNRDAGVLREVEVGTNGVALATATKEGSSSARAGSCSNTASASRIWSWLSISCSLGKACSR
mmetsp:Transcript_18082/g.50605  ORF Transcript_18082/g.50605 Transcript_18082/m.50605 type:complete len:204 (-) Transcript_18082:85-696(-)